MENLADEDHRLRPHLVSRFHPEVVDPRAEAATVEDLLVQARSSPRIHDRCHMTASRVVHVQPDVGGLPVADGVRERLLRSPWTTDGSSPSPVSGSSSRTLPHCIPTMRPMSVWQVLCSASSGEAGLTMRRSPQSLQNRGSTLMLP